MKVEEPPINNVKIVAISTGIQGLPGSQGIQGLSAYQIAISNGYIGTIQQWLLSLKGNVNYIK